MSFSWRSGLVVGCTIVTLAACGGGEGTGGGSPAGVGGGAGNPGAGGAGGSGNPLAQTFPNFRQLAFQVAPILKKGNAPFNLSYVEPGSWAAARDRLVEVLGDPNEDPKVVTKMGVLIAEAQSVLTAATAASGSCRVVASDAVVRTPWFSDHHEQPFFPFPETGAFSCALDDVAGPGSKLLLGRVAIPAPPAGCADPHVYTFLLASVADHQPVAPMDRPEERGSWQSIAQVMKGSYDQCTGDLKLAYAHITEYERGMKFGSRSELMGNVNRHSFALRTIKLDVLRAPDGRPLAQFLTSNAAGRSQTAGDEDHLIISYRFGETFTPGAPVAFAPAQVFCLRVSGTGYLYAPVAGGACAAHESTYGGLVHFESPQVPFTSWTGIDLFGPGMPIDGSLVPPSDAGAPADAADGDAPVAADGGPVDGGGPGDGGVPSPGPAPGPACTSDTPLTVTPLEAANLRAITPLGALNPPGHALPTTHTYQMLPVSEGMPGGGPFGDGRFPAQVAVRSPGAVRVVEVSRSTVRTPIAPGTTLSYSEDALTANVCGTRYITFGHITITSPAINNAIAALADSTDRSRRDCHEYETGGSQYAMCRYFIDVPVAAGEVVATTSGRAFALDVGAYDLSRPTSRIGAGQRFVGESGHTACPYDWFAGEAREALYAKLGEEGPQGLIPRTAEPRCGRADHDQRGTALGNWYVRGGPMDWEPEDLDLALVPDNLDPSIPVVSVGNAEIPGLPRGLYTYTPGSEGPAFATLTPGTTACFKLRPHRNRGSDLTGKLVLVALGTDPTTARETLRIAATPGSECTGATLPATTARFER